jgi:hypothetical protein
MHNNLKNKIIKSIKLKSKIIMLKSKTYEVKKQNKKNIINKDKN